LLNIDIVLIGDDYVGKTSLRKRIMREHYQSIYKMTIGAEVSTFHKNIADIQVKYHLWDLSGQSFFSQVRSNFYSGVLGCIVVFDVTKKESFEKVPFWIKEALKYSGNGNPPILLIGNKVDLRNDIPGSLTCEHGQTLASEIRNLPRKEALSCLYMDTSAKTGKNVDKVLLELTSLILEKKEPSQKISYPIRSASI
jgi:Ras-related protein Rab-2A